jgi:hypothetical protein
MDIMKYKWFDYVVADKNLWADGWTTKKLEKVKSAVLSDKDILYDLLERHDGQTMEPEQMKETDKVMYEHCISNFVCNIHYKMMEIF